MVARPSKGGSKDPQKNSENEETVKNSAKSKLADQNYVVITKTEPLINLWDAAQADVEEKFAYLQRNGIKKSTNFEDTQRRKRIQNEILRVTKRKARAIIGGWPTETFTVFAIPVIAYGFYFAFTSPLEATGFILPKKFKGLQAKVGKPNQLTAETCKTVDLINKMDWTTYKKINYSPSCTFVVCNPDFRLANSRFYGGVFKNTFKTFKNSNFMLLSKNNHLVYSTSFLYQHAKALERLNDFKISSKTLNQNQLRKLRYWQNLHIQYDSLPVKTNAIFGRGSYCLDKTKSDAMEINPLFKHVHKVSINTKTVFKESWHKKAFRRKVVRAHEALTQSHVETLNKALLEQSPFLKSGFAGKHRVMQYKTANSLRALRDVMQLHVHSGPMIITEDKTLFIDHYFKKEFLIQKALQNFSENSTPLRRPQSRNMMDYRLRLGLHKDIVRFHEQAYDKLHVVTTDVPTSSLHAYDIKVTRNPYNLIYENQNLFRLTVREDHAILPQFQKRFNKYILKSLHKFGLNKDSSKASLHPLIFNLKPALTKPHRYSLKAVRIKRHHKHFSQEQIQQIQRRVIKGDSDLLKRQFSGYLFPDTFMDDLFDQNVRYKNRFFIQGNPNIDDVFIKLSGPHELNFHLHQNLTNINLTQANQNFKMQRLQEPMLREKAKLWGVVNQDFGGAITDKNQDAPKRYRYGKRGWRLWMDPPNPKLESRQYDFDFTKPYLTEADEAFFLNPQWENDYAYLSENQRYLPLPNSPSTSNTSVISKPGIYKPSMTVYRFNFHRFLTQFNIGMSSYSGLDGYFKKEFKPQGNYQNVGHSYLLQKCSVYDPLFIAQLLTMVYLYCVGRKLTHDYSDSFYEGLEQFLFSLRIKDLFNFKSLETFVVPPGAIALSDIMGARNLISHLLPTILFLRHKRQRFEELPFNNKNSLQPDFSWIHALNEEKYNQLVNLWTQHPEKAVSNKTMANYTSTFVPKGFLLVGSPGTGKTFLAQALSGETNCPVITNSYEKYPKKNLNANQLEAYQKTTIVRKLFKAAKFRAPSILFIDELDTLGAKRSLVLGTRNQKPVGPKLFYTYNDIVKKNAFIMWQRNSLLEQSPDLNRTSVPYWSIFNPNVAKTRLSPRTNKPYFKANLGYFVPDAKYYLGRQRQEQGLESVTILLTELDGIANRDDVVVIGATNRPKVLDPALTRPGRLGEVIYLDLPPANKRLELLQFYAGPHFSEAVDWKFFASHGQTGGLSSAHLKVAMNLSTLALIRQALNKKASKTKTFGQWFKNPVKLQHTHSTIEHGIQSVRFQNVYVKSLSTRLSNNLHDRVFTSVNRCLNNQYYLINQVAPGAKATNYIISCVAGIKTPQPALPQITVGANVSAPKPISQLSLSARVAAKVYASFGKDVRAQYIFTDKKNLYFNRKPEVFVSESKVKKGFGLERIDEILKGQPSKRELFELYLDYHHHTFRHHLFGSRLLINTPYAINNSLLFNSRSIKAKFENETVESSFKWACFSHRNLVHFDFINHFANKSFLPPFDKTIESIQKTFLGETQSLQRAAYYSAGKALILSLLEDSLFDGVTITLWSNIASFQENRMTQKNFVQTIAGQLIRKEDFEKYLLSLIGGKVGEQMYLLDQKIKNYSTLGINELHKMGWLANIMVEKGLFYDVNSNILKQSVLGSIPLSLNNSIKSVQDSNKSVGKPNAMLDGSNDWRPISNWWESKLQYDANNIVFDNSTWARFAEHPEDSFNLKYGNLVFFPGFYEDSVLMDTQTVHNEEVRLRPSKNQVKVKDEKSIKDKSPNFNENWKEGEQQFVVDEFKEVESKETQQAESVNVEEDESTESTKMVVEEQAFVEKGSTKSSPMEQESEFIRPESKVMQPGDESLKDEENVFMENEFLEGEEDKSRESEEDKSRESEGSKESTESEESEEDTEDTEGKSIKQKMLMNVLDQPMLELMFNFTDLRWHDLSLMHSQQVFSSLILQAFGQAFTLIEENRSLFDYFVHYIYVNDHLTGLEAKRIADKFLESLVDPPIDGPKFNLPEDLEKSSEEDLEQDSEKSLDSDSQADLSNDFDTDSQNKSSDESSVEDVTDTSEATLSDTVSNEQLKENIVETSIDSDEISSSNDSFKEKSD